MTQFKNYTQFKDWKLQKQNIYGEQSDIYFQQLGQKLRESGQRANLAKAAFFDIYEELQHNNNDAQLVWQVLFQTHPILEDVDPEKQGERIHSVRELKTDMFPSSIENIRHRNSHTHLVDLVYASGIFNESKADRDDVAQRLYKYYDVLDMGGKQNIVFTKRELTEQNLDIDDIEENLPLILKFFDKTDSQLIPFPVNAFGDSIGDEYDQPELIKKIVKDMRGDPGKDDGASLWTSFRRSEDGKGLEVNVTAGNWDTGSFHEVGVWGYKDKDNQIRPLIIPMNDMYKMIKAAKKSHWMDAMNDPWETGAWVGTKRMREFMRDKGMGFMIFDSLKEKIGEWYQRGKEYTKEDGKTKSRKYWGSKDGDWLSIPNWAIEVADPKAFEFENIIVPFWEKYGPKGMDLSDEEFENMWQKELETGTITFEDRFMSWWIDQFTDLIAPPGGFRGRTRIMTKTPFE